MNSVCSILSLFVFLSCLNCDELFVAKFQDLNQNPTPVGFTNNLEINNNGGHLQGVQLIERNGNKYAVLSGSSDLYSYYSVVKLGDDSEVISVNKILDKPFKHAGGFQIFQNYMAVGVEDNEKKDKSKVYIFDISNPENSDSKPFFEIERNGEPLRSTAGCVGITSYKNKILLVVGDWDTKHLDFYQCDFENQDKSSAQLIYTIDTDKMSKSGWVDNNWYSYQNINLIACESNTMYLIGLGKNNQDKDVADLFALKEINSRNFELTKLVSKTFNSSNQCNFKAAAGIYLTETGNLEIVSSGYNLKNDNQINYLNVMESTLK